MFVQRFPIDVDLSEMSFETACGMVRAMPNQVTLYCGTRSSALAQKLEEKYHCKLVLVPVELLATQFGWGVVGLSGTAWSMPPA